jgi:hypothetical protein
VAARRHAADEHARVAGVRLHADAVAEDRAAAERARGIDGHDADRPARARNSASAIDERALAGAGRPGDPIRYAFPVRAKMRRRAFGAGGASSR